MLRRKLSDSIENSNMREIEAYTHDDKKRVNNPPAGIAQYDMDEGRKRAYSFDPHLDPAL